MKPASTMKELFTNFNKLIKLPEYYSEHASRYSQSTGKPVKYVNKPSYRNSLTIGINFDTELKVTDKLKKEVLKGGIYKMGSNIFELSHWNDTRENYEGVDVSIIKIINVR